MCCPAKGLEVHPERALLPHREAVLSGLTIDEKPPLGGEPVRRSGTVRPVLLPNQEQQAYSALSALEQSPGRRHHRGGQTLGVTAATAVNRLRVLRKRNVGRNSVQVGGENDA